MEIETTRLGCGFDPTDSYLYDWACYQNRSCASLANNDIAGTGMQILIAFVTTASLTVLLAWAMVVFGCKENLQVGDQRNRIDIGFSSCASWLLGLRGKYMSTRWGICCQSSMMRLSDIHLATGLALLIAGYTQSRRLIIYHFHAVVYLAWISSSIHLLTLIACRSYLQKRPVIMYWRLAGICTLFIMLFVAICLSGSPRWPGASYTIINSHEVRVHKTFVFDTPLVCAWIHGDFSSLAPDTCIALALISWGLLSRLSKLLIAPSRFWRRHLQHIPGSCGRILFDTCLAHERRALSNRSSIIWKFTLWLVLAAYMHTRALYDIYSSVLAEMLWSTLTLIYGVSEIYAWRRISPLRHVESSWTFGQVLVVVLVLGPFLALPEALQTEREDIRQNESPPLLPNGTSQSMGIRPIVEHRKTRLQRPPLLTAHEVAYQSPAFKALIGLMIVSWTALYLLVIGCKLAGILNPVRQYWGPSLAYILFPLTLGPSVFFFIFMAPFSDFLRRQVRLATDMSSKSHALG